VKRLTLILVLLLPFITSANVRERIAYAHPWSVNMVVSDATANDGTIRFFTPCNGANSGVAITGNGNENRCRVDRDTIIHRFSATMVDNMNGATEKCTFELFLNGAVQIWSRINVGNGETLTCTLPRLTDADLDINGESCTQINRDGVLLLAGQYYVFRKTSGSTNCARVVSVGLEVSGVQR
jgi:hypothetical protein